MGALLLGVVCFVVQLVVGADNLEESVEFLATLAACFETDKLDPEVETVRFDVRRDVLDLCLEKDRFLVGHRGELKPDQLTRAEVDALVCVDGDLHAARGQIQHLALPVIVQRRLGRIVHVAAVPEEHLDFQFAGGGDARIDATLHALDLIGYFEQHHAAACPVRDGFEADDDALEDVLGEFLLHRQTDRLVYLNVCGHLLGGGLDLDLYGGWRHGEKNDVTDVPFSGRKVCHDTFGLLVDKAVQNLCNVLYNKDFRFSH